MKWLEKLLCKWTGGERHGSKISTRRTVDRDGFEAYCVECGAMLVRWPK